MANDAGKLITDLWWFIENVTDDDATRTDQFFALRERVRGEALAYPIVTLYAPQILSDAVERLADDEEEGFISPTLAQAQETCDSVARDDWSDTYGEASWRAVSRLIALAREIASAVAA